MFEKLYAFALRLYPVTFREHYGAEALELLRERLKEETGVLERFRLTIELIGDLTTSLPCQWIRSNADRLTSVVRAEVEGSLSLCVLEEHRPSSAALLAGIALALGLIAVFPFLVHERTMSVYAASGGNRAHLPSRSEGGFHKFDNHTSDNDDNSTPQGDQPLDRGASEKVLASVIANLKQHYVDQERVKSVEAALLAHQKQGDYEGVSGAALARLLTRDIREASQDQHLEVVYFGESSSPRRMASPPSTDKDCGFRRSELLPGKIGYIKLDKFADPSVCAAEAEGAMAAIDQADAIIFDLRDNRGGYPGMVMLLASYLFDHPEYMYNPREEMSERLWTRSPVPQAHLSDKRVFVLTSRRTMSGAEHFSYNLKMLKRATLIGEVTGGATDVGAFHRMNQNFGIGIRETHAVNPYTELDWAARGVKPDIELPEAEALTEAVRLAKRPNQGSSNRSQ